MTSSNTRHSVGAARSISLSVFRLAAVIDPLSLSLCISPYCLSKSIFRKILRKVYFDSVGSTGIFRHSPFTQSLSKMRVGQINIHVLLKFYFLLSSYTSNMIPVSCFTYTCLFARTHRENQVKILLPDLNDSSQSLMTKILHGRADSFITTSHRSFVSSPGPPLVATASWLPSQHLQKRQKHEESITKCHTSNT